MRSSYIKNDFGSILRALILAHKPKFVIECGVLDGYSTFHIAHALKFNHRRGFNSEFVAYDLWENYEYKHGTFKEVATMLREQGNLLNKYVNLHYGDAFKVSNYFNDGVVDFLHMDISNDGDILQETIKHWGSKISPGGIIAFEGGSQERDKVEWMVKYNRKPIAPEVVNVSFDTEFSAQVFTAFPSMTLFFKR